MYKIRIPNNSYSRNPRIATLIATAILMNLYGCTTTPGNANYSSDFQKNIYANVGLGTSRLTPDVSNYTNLDVNERIVPAGQVTIGADLSNTFSVEVHSADLGSAGFSPAGGADGSVSAGRYNYQMNGASALAYFGKNKSNANRSGVNGYGRLGLVSINNSTVGDSLNYQRDSGSGILLGAGVEYATRQGLGLRAELMATDSDIKYGQIGISYRIGLGNNAPAVAAAKAAPPTPEIEAAASVIQSQSQTAETIIPIAEVVYFDLNSAWLTSSAQETLNSVADRLASHPDAQIRVSAHADSTGSDSYNQQLSQRRADSVIQYLSNLGITSRSIASTAQGESAPINSNSTEQGRHNNRRVEIRSDPLTIRSYDQ